MVQTAADPTNSANGIAKKVMGKVQAMQSDKGLKVLNRIPYDSDTTLGASYNELVWLTGEHGFTYGGTDGAALTLNAPAVAESKEAVLYPESLHFRSRTTMELMSRAKSNNSEASYENYIKRLMINSRQAFDHRLEMKLIYGGLSIGTVVTGDAGTATTWAPTISTATWAPGAWIGKRNCAFDAYNGSTKLNTRGDLVCTAVNVKTRVISFSGVAGDITDIKAVGTNGSTVTLYYKGAYSTSTIGLKTIAKLSSSSGNYLGIACGTYPDFWTGTQVTWDVTAEDFTWTILQNGLEESFNKGRGGNRICEVPPGVWKTLNSSLDALRAFDSSYSVSKVEMGHKIDAITYHSLGFRVTVECNRNMMGGDVIVFPDPGADDTEDGMTGDINRKGSSNVTFNLPDKGGELFTQIYGTNLVEHGAFSDQALWAPCPADFLIFNND